MTNTVAIIQARMSSTRLPQKVLLDIQGYPMLYHVVERLRHARHVSHIVVATSDQEADKPIVAYVDKLAAQVFMGSETDVLARFWGAAQMAKADHILRITADCPLIDPVSIDELITAHLNSGADYTSNVRRRTYPRGLDAEVFSMETLRQTYLLSSKLPHREHVTPFIYENPDRFRLLDFDATGELRRPDIRLCVDTAADLALLREIYHRFYEPGKIIDVRAVICGLDTAPEWKTINTDAEQEHLHRNAREGIRQIKVESQRGQEKDQIGDH